MDTNLFWCLRGTYDERKAKLSGASREFLEATILDSQYNDFIRQKADYHEDDHDPHGHCKRIPYIGWYWRHIEFSSPTTIPVGDCGEFIGFMENNKWDHPERCLTEPEARTIIRIIDEAIAINERGGLVSDIIKDTNQKLDEIWDYMQTLKV